MATNDRRVFDQAGTALRRIGRAPGRTIAAYAVPRSHHLLLAQDADPALQQACNELAYALQRNLRDGGIRGGVTFCDANNEPLTERCEWSRMLRVAGFVPVPQGMKLYC